MAVVLAVAAGDRHATATEKRPESWLTRVEHEGHGLVTDEVVAAVADAWTGPSFAPVAMLPELVRKVRDTGVTILMVEHVMEIVMPLVDRAIVLDLGKVLVEGKPSDVVRDPKGIGAYLGDRHAVGA